MSKSSFMPAKGEAISWIDATAIISATTIGAGILALPIALCPFGTLGSALFLLAVGGLSLAAALLLAEMLMRTDGGTHLPSLADAYLGKPGVALIFAGTLIYIYGSLTAYLIAGGALANSLSGGSIPNYVGTLAYFAVVTAIVYGGARMVKGAEKASLAVLLILSLIVTALALPYSGFVDATAGIGEIPAAFGVVLFACFVHEVIPSVRKRMRRDPRGFIKALIAGSAIPLALYIIWTVVLIGAIPQPLLAAAGTAGQPATVPLGIVAGALVVLLGSLFAVFSTASSYVGASFGLVDAFRDLFGDMHQRLGKELALLFSVLPPLYVAIESPLGFVKALEIAGIYGGGLAIGIVIPLAYFVARRKGRRKPEFSLPFPLGEIIAAIVLGVTLAMLIYETWSLLIGT